MLGRALKMACWVTYDHLGKLILANVLWSLAILVPGMAAYTAFLTEDAAVRVILGVPLAALTAGVVLPVFTVGLAYMAAVLIDQRDGTFRDFFTGMRRYGRRAAAVGLLFLLGGCCLGTSAWFYAAQLCGTAPWLGYGLSALAVWGLAFLGLMSLLVMPTLVQKKAPVRETLKLTALLVLDNLLFCAGLAVQFLALAAISIVVAPLFFFLSGALAMALACSAYEQLARKYALVEFRKTGRAVGEEGVRLEVFSGGIRVVSRKGVLTLDDGEDDYLNRGFRDFLFPWKG